jgi:large subunit ribosomal protein L24
MNKIRRGDEVIVLSGKDRGARGIVLTVVSSSRLLVGGINKVKKHTKPNPMKGDQGGISEKEMPIEISNVALFNPATQKADRVGIKVLDDGSRVRVYKSNGEFVLTSKAG